MNPSIKKSATDAFPYQSEISGVAIDSLVEQFGCPLFVLSEQQLRLSVRRIRKAFSTRYANVRQAWSYKTNYLSAVCALLHQEGCDAEVVSAFEYEKARRLGVPGSRIYFNGPHKPRAALVRAVADGTHVHLDHLEELDLLEDVVREAGRVNFPVTLRLNFDTGFVSSWGRFGFNLENGQAMYAAQRIAASPYLTLTGLHNHIGTSITEPRAYANQIDSLIDFMDKVEAATGCTISTLDIGGGFASQSVWHGTQLKPEEIPTAEQFAEAICTRLNEGLKQRTEQGKPLPELVLETGRAVVDESQWLITRVIANKRLPDGQRAIVLDAGVNILPTGLLFKHELRPVRALSGALEEATVYGPLCMNTDVVLPACVLPPLEAGELLSVWPVGAYNNTQWTQFISLRPAVVMVREDGRVDVVRAAETFEDVTRNECLPGDLMAEF